MSNETMSVKDLVQYLESVLNIPENHHIIAVFENNESDEILGYVCVEEGVEADYPIYSFEQLVEEYGLTDEKLSDIYGQRI